MSFRDLELLDAIQRDDLAFVMSCRYEKPLFGLYPEDCHPMLLNEPNALMVSAFFGSFKCFTFLSSFLSYDYLDAQILIFFYHSLIILI